MHSTKIHQSRTLGKRNIELNRALAGQFEIILSGIQMIRLPRNDNATLTVVAGPNGAGKSGITISGDLVATTNLVDPDAIAKRLNPIDPAQAALSAGRQAILMEREFIQRAESFTCRNNFGW